MSIYYICFYLQALIGGVDSLPTERNIRVLTLFDNEEVSRGYRSY